MNNEDLIEKLKLMLIDKMLEIEELKRDAETKAISTEGRYNCYKISIQNLEGRLRTSEDRGDYLDKQCQMLSHKIKVLEDEKKDRYPGFGQLYFYPKDEPGFELKGKLRDLKQPIDILFQHLPGSEVVILGKAPSRYHCGGDYWFEATDELMKEKSEV